MRKENYLLVIWIIFGFVFIQAIDSVLNFITYIYYICLSTIGISFKILIFVIPVLTFFSYIITALLLVKKVKLKSNIIGIYLTDFPKKGFIILATIAVFLGPITYKIGGLYAEHSDVIQNSEPLDFFAFHGWMTFGINISRWLVLIYLIFVYLNKNNNKLHQ